MGSSAFGPSACRPFWQVLCAP